MVLLAGFPFMFLGSITDFFFPNFIGLAINAMRTGDQSEVLKNIVTWVVFMCIGAVCSFIRDSFFGITSERIGRSLRSKLFEALIKKDVSFFDDNRTGDICKSII
jgi:ABC-type multidrug transport system fused ATPase/permease subunit